MADLPYRVVIGLEVHVQLLTKTKLFCGCRTDFGLPPNSATCPVCIGMPGTLPVMNRRAFDLALRAALALNCKIAPFTKWDRKNYYYPPLPLWLIGASVCEMQWVSLRSVAIVNVHVPQPGGGFAATPIVEVKNLNSFRAVERAMKFEAQRQYEQFLADGKKLGDKGVSK